MIGKVLSAFSKEMEQYLGSFFHQPEGLVDVTSIGGQNDEEPSKLVISLLGLERENVQQRSNAVKMGTGNIYGTLLPPIYMNMHVVIAAVYPGKRYEESLSVLSQAVAFIQNNPYFIVHSTGKYTVELMNVSWQDTSNIWSGMGGHYYPSVICKIRRLTFSSGEMNRIVSEFKNTDVSIK